MGSKTFEFVIAGMFGDDAGERGLYVLCGAWWWKKEDTQQQQYNNTIIIMERRGQEQPIWPTIILNS